MFDIELTSVCTLLLLKLQGSHAHPVQKENTNTERMTIVTDYNQFQEEKPYLLAL